MSRTVELVAPWAGPDFEPRGVVEFVVGDGAPVFSGQKIASFLPDADGLALIEFDVVTEYSGVLRHHCNQGYKSLIL